MAFQAICNLRFKSLKTMIFQFFATQLSFCNHLFTMLLNYKKSMKIQIDKDNFVIISPETGGRILHLFLNGHTIIHAHKPYKDNGSGNFLMFPWLSKAPQNPYKPQLKNQYHGCSINTPRSVEIEYINHSKIMIKLQEIEKHAQRHNFEEIYIIGRAFFSIHFKAIENQKDDNPYCFGYHPYLQIDGSNLEQMQIKTDITTLLEFDENILPIYPFQRRKVQINSKGSYNNLFEGGNFFELIHKGVHAKISSDLPFWQIYTPQQRTKIAIQPASFCGNLYNIFKQNPSIKLAKQGTIKFQVWKD